MIAASPELPSWADVLSKFGQFLFGLCTLIIAIWAATTKRKELFRSELTKKQLKEVGEIRGDLQSLFFDLYYIPIISQTMRAMEWSIDHLRENDPDAWDQVMRYKRTSLDLFYKFSSRNYYLFPDWLERKKITAFAKAMEVFAPFTLNSTSSKSEEERREYAEIISDLQNHFDEALRAKA